MKAFPLRSASESSPNWKVLKTLTFSTLFPSCYLILEFVFYHSCSVLDLEHYTVQVQFKKREVYNTHQALFGTFPHPTSLCCPTIPSRAGELAGQGRRTYQATCFIRICCARALRMSPLNFSPYLGFIAVSGWSCHWWWSTMRSIDSRCCKDHYRARILSFPCYFQCFPTTIGGL